MKVSKEGLREGARIAFRDRIVRGYHELRGDEVSEAMLAINMSVDQWHTFIGMCEGLIGDDEIDQFLLLDGMSLFTVVIAIGISLQMTSICLCLMRFLGLEILKCHMSLMNNRRGYESSFEREWADYVDRRNRR